MHRETQPQHGWEHQSKPRNSAADQSAKPSAWKSATKGTPPTLYQNMLLLYCLLEYEDTKKQWHRVNSYLGNHLVPSTNSTGETLPAGMSSDDISQPLQPRPRLNRAGKDLMQCIRFNFTRTNTPKPRDTVAGYQAVVGRLGLLSLRVEHRGTPIEPATGHAVVLVYDITLMAQTNAIGHNMARTDHGFQYTLDLHHSLDNCDAYGLYYLPSGNAANNDYQSGKKNAMDDILAHGQLICLEVCPVSK